MSNITHNVTIKDNQFINSNLKRDPVNNIIRFKIDKPINEIIYSNLNDNFKDENYHLQQASDIQKNINFGNSAFSINIVSIL